MAKKAKSPAKKKALGYNLREILGLVSQGEEGIERNLMVLDRRLGNKTFEAKWPSYERKKIQLQKLLEKEYTEVERAVMDGLTRSNLRPDEQVKALGTYKIDLPLTKEEIKHG
jgi:hypothetical protein